MGAIVMSEMKRPMTETAEPENPQSFPAFARYGSSACMRRKSLPAWALTLAAGMTVPAIALAYILPADAILASVAARRARIDFSTLVAEGTLQNGDGARVPVWEAIRAGKAHRVEHRGEERTEVILTVDKKRWRFTLGQPPGPPERVTADLIMTFLGTPARDPGGRRGILFLKRHKIDEDVVSLDRLGGQIAYVIGAKPWEGEKPQLWIDKEFLLPIRLITEGKDGSTLDVRLLGYGSGATGEWYPRRIQTYRNGELIETVTYDSAELNTNLDDGLFEPPS